MGRDKTRIRNRIRSLRRLSDGMTQQQLADRIGVTRQTVNAIEGEKYSPSLEVAFRIAHTFGQPLQDVFEYETPRSVAETADGGSGRSGSTEPSPSDPSAESRP